MAEARLGPAVDLPLGEGRAYLVGPDRVAVFRLRDGTVRAVSAVCPHANGPIADGQVDSTVVICPLHLHVFELATGSSRTGQPPLRTYPVRVEGGEVYVTVPEES
jgi:nitrite reductase/ring-hydroxylating ferredoxin subunit